MEGKFEERGENAVREGLLDEVVDRFEELNAVEMGVKPRRPLCC